MSAVLQPISSGMIYDNWTPEDFQRLNKLNLGRKLIVLPMVRKGDRPDADIMVARMRAQQRGATPVEVQQNVAKFDSDAFPIPVKRGPWS